MLNEKKNKGITLIALVVSIIVLLILAGVSISAITGNESAMEKAKEARTANEQGAELEQIKLAVVSAMSQGLDVKVNAVNLRTSLNGIVTQTEIDKVTENGPWIIQGNSGREYKITNNGLVNALETMNKAIISTISVEERAKEPIVISNGDSIEEIKLCTIADNSIATVAKDTDGIWKITGGTITGDEQSLTTTMDIEGKSGKKVENITVTLLKVTTAKDVIPAPTNSATCAYVKYAMNGQTEENAQLCRVLYNDSSHGLQIITVDSVEIVNLGSGDENYNIGNSNQKAANSYNNAIINLNNKAKNYINLENNIVVDARCVGSKSLASGDLYTNKNDEDLLTNPNNYSYLQIYVENGYKGVDSNHTEDCNKITTLNINKTQCWLASRYVDCDSNRTFFTVRYLNWNGSVANENLLEIRNTGYWEGKYPTKGFRPVFLINPTAKIASGSGTEQDPYILEAGE